MDISQMPSIIHLPPSVSTKKLGRVSKKVPAGTPVGSSTRPPRNGRWMAGADFYRRDLDLPDIRGAGGTDASNTPRSARQPQLPGHIQRLDSTWVCLARTSRSKRKCLHLCQHPI